MDGVYITLINSSSSRVSPVDGITGTRKTSRYFEVPCNYPELFRKPREVFFVVFDQDQYKALPCSSLDIPCSPFTPSKMVPTEHLKTTLRARPVASITRTGCLQRRCSLLFILILIFLNSFFILWNEKKKLFESFLFLFAQRPTFFFKPMVTKSDVRFELFKEPINLLELSPCCFKFPLPFSPLFVVVVLVLALFVLFCFSCFFCAVPGTACWNTVPSRAAWRNSGAPRGSGVLYLDV